MSYASLLRSPYVARLLTGTLIGRLPTGMAALAIPLVLRQAGAPFSTVGAAAGSFALATAAGGPLLGRLVDRVGQPRVLFPAAVLAGAGFILIGVAPRNIVVTILGAVVAGAATPPLEPCLRALWPRIVGPAQLERAYAVDSGSQELIYVGAPLVVSAAAAAYPPAALWLAAALGLVGVLIVATSAPSREYRVAARSTDWWGALRNRGLGVLYVGLIGVGVAIGSLNVLVVAYAEQRNVWGGAGGLLALNALGALVGAVGYGWMKWRMPLPQRLQSGAVGIVLAYSVLAALPSPPWMALIMILTGFFLAPLLTISFVTVERLAAPGTTTEAFAWLITVFTAGMALGAAVVGWLLEHSSPTLAAWSGAVATTMTVVTFFLGRRTLVPAGAPSHVASAT